MSLVIDISVNGEKVVSVVTAQRVAGPDIDDPKPDSVFTYKVERLERRPDNDLLFAHTTTTLAHRYGDGATALAAKALAAVYVDGETWP
jgi:hypothetical protein